MPPSSTSPAAPSAPETIPLRLRLARLLPLALRAPLVTQPALWLSRLIDHGRPKPRFAGRVALIAHAYYVDLIGEIVAAYDNLPEGAHLIVTTPRDEIAAATSALSGVRRATVIGVDNRGRDVAPFLMLLGSGRLDAYDVVLKLHGKRSLHARTGNILRRSLFQTLAGSRRRVARILALFADETTGMVGWPGAWRNAPAYWLANRARVADLLSRMGIAPPADPAFFEGTMFWLRPAALRRLRALDIASGDFEVEAGQTDGALHHAIERVFAVTVAAEGLAIRDPSGRELPPRP